MKAKGGEFNDFWPGVEGGNVDVRGYAQVTALINAAQNGHSDIVRQLLEAGADINATNDFGVTALIWAATKGHSDIVRQLLEAGADINAKDIDNDGDTALINAAQKGHSDIIRQLLEASADINATNDYGVTALRVALQRGNLECGRILQAAGAR